MIENWINREIESWQRWLQRPRSFGALALALVFTVLAHVFQDSPVLQPLSDLTRSFGQSLSNVDAWRVTDRFYTRLSGCELFTSNSSASVSCEQKSIFDRWQTTTGGGGLAAIIIGVPEAFLTSTYGIFLEANWLSVVLWTIALLTAAIVLWLWLDPFEWDPGWVGLIVFILLLPFLAGVLALGLKWILVALSFALSEVLGGIATVVATIYGYVKAAGLLFGTINTADKIESGLQTVAREPAKPPQEPRS
ncbi:MAG TPA: hypothetical protein DCL54_10675 [Alphaproteobacteria bacterium]|nr:hypothetical protein [Alphaproteobacteria bacterium]HAJ47032.1 hypothetical protein [Alphaproteobacteria bacterium]